MQKQNTVKKPFQDVFIWEKDAYNFLICQFTTNNESELFRQNLERFFLGDCLLVFVYFSIQEIQPRVLHKLDMY